VYVGFSGSQIGAGLMQLLIHFRRIDFRQQLAGLHTSANVCGPAPQISVRAGVDGRIFEGLHIRW